MEFVFPENGSMHSRDKGTAINWMRYSPATNGIQSGAASAGAGEQERNPSALDIKKASSST